MNITAITNPLKALLLLLLGLSLYFPSEIQGKCITDDPVQCMANQVKSIITQNHQNDLAGLSHLNQYVIYLKPNKSVDCSQWVQDISKSSTDLSELAKPFVDDPILADHKARFYVIYIEDFVVPISEDFNRQTNNRLLEELIDVADTQRKKNIRQRLRDDLLDKLGHILAEVDKCPSNAEQIFYYVTGSAVWDFEGANDERVFYFLDAVKGETFNDSKAYQYIKSKTKIIRRDLSHSIFNQLKSIVNSLGNAMKDVLTGQANYENLIFTQDCDKLYKKYKNSPLHQSHILHQAIERNHCVLQGMKPFGDIPPQSQWMKELMQVVNGGLRAGLVPAAAGVLGSVFVEEYLRKKAGEMLLGAMIDASLQVTIQMAFQGKNFEAALAGIDQSQVARSALESLIDPKYAVLISCLGDGLLTENNQIDANLTLKKFSYDCAKGAVSQLILNQVLKRGGPYLAKLKRIAIDKPLNFGYSLLRLNIKTDAQLARVCKYLGLDDVISKKVRTACFVAGTPVWDAQGNTFAIEQAIAGQTKVLHYDPHTAALGIATVRAVQKSVSAELLGVVSGVDTLWATPNHPFLLSDGTYLMAADLEVGMSLQGHPARAWQAAQGIYLPRQRLEVEGILALDTVVTVYNLLLDDGSTYLVGEEGMVVAAGCDLARFANLFKNKETLAKIGKLSQDEADVLFKDLADNSDLIKELDLDEGIVDAWSVLSSQKQYRQALPELKKVNDLVTNTSRNDGFIQYIKSQFDNKSSFQQRKFLDDEIGQMKNITNKHIYGNILDDETEQLVKVMNHYSTKSSFFGKSAPGIEGFMFKNQALIPISLKKFPSDNIKNPFRKIRDNANKIAQNINQYRGVVKLGNNPNTILGVEIMSFDKEEILKYLDSNSNILPPKGTYKEIFIISKDNQKILIDEDLNISK